jgi:hypothetical protein
MREVDGEQDRNAHHRDEVTTAIQMSSVSMIAAMLSTPTAAAMRARRTSRGSEITGCGGGTGSDVERIEPGALPLGIIHFGRCHARTRP